MLRSTYIHIPGISPGAEKSLWMQGATTWDMFLQAPYKWNIDGQDNADIARLVSNSIRRLQATDFRYFRRRIPEREHWRAFPEFSDRVVYLDIETDGGWTPSSITMIGCYDGSKFRVFIKGKDLDAFPSYLRKFGLIVTFFGSNFDIPIMRKMYFGIPIDQLHVDLWMIMRRLGYKGGLKRIERLFNVVRDPDTEGLTGRDAVRLWHHFQQGDKAALDLLVRYNCEDVTSLKTLMHRGYDMLKKSLLPNEPTPIARQVVYPTLT